MTNIEVKCKGKCVTRNGEYQIGAIRIEMNGDNKVNIRFVSSKLRRALHSGATIDGVAMDKLALKWVAARQLREAPACGVDHFTVKTMLNEAAGYIRAAQDKFRS